MMRAALAAAALLAAAPATARTVDYTQSEAQFAADAEALDVAEVPAMPERGAVDVVIEDAAKLDQRLKILGIGCRFWKVENPLSGMVARTLSSWDKDGRLDDTGERPLIRFRVGSALATMRCVEVAEMKSRCLTRTAIGGEAVLETADAAPRSVPVAIEVEQQQSVGVCGGLSRGTGLSGRAASIALVERLREIAAAN